MNVVPTEDQGRFALLAPPRAAVPENFHRVDRDHEWHARMLARVQRLRGEVYLEEGAIRKSQLTEDGRHHLPVDGPAWHVLALDDIMRIRGCSRYFSHSNTTHFSKLGVSSSPLAKSREWGMKFRAAVEAEVDIARRRGIAYVEVGGWALMPEHRRGMEALRIALATYSLARALGGCIGIATVTQRHASSSILRRIGGRPLSFRGVELPAYYDPHYRCEMEIIRFDSSDPNPRFESWIDELSDYLRAEPVIHGEYPPVRVPLPVASPEVVRFRPSLVAAV